MTEFAQDTVKPNPDNPAVPKVLHWLPAVFLLGVVSVGAALTVIRPEVRRWPQDQAVMTGQAMATYEKTNLDPNVPWRTPSVNLWGGMNYRLFGEARDGAVIGTDGWLFTSEEFQTTAGDAQEIQAKVAYIRQVHDQLATDGVQLVIALIPAKVRVYADHLGRVQVPAVNAGVYQDVRRQLVQAGIPTPDLLASMRSVRTSTQDWESVFLRTDSHWTPRGAALAATDIARAVKALDRELPPAEYDMQVKPAVTRAGDLLRYVPAPAGTGPAPDIVQELEYTRTDDGGGGLLGDETLAVTLVGTSYSANTEANVWHFDQALARALGTEVLNAAQEGKGPITPMREYLTGQDRQDSPPQVVVWELPERFLRVPYPTK